MTLDELLKNKYIVFLEVNIYMDWTLLTIDNYLKNKDDLYSDITDLGFDISVNPFNIKDNKIQKFLEKHEIKTLTIDNEEQLYYIYYFELSETTYTLLQLQQ